MTNPRDIVTVERVINAPADKIFDLLADPRRHQEIDGSGTLREATVEAPDRLSMGAVFTMKMHLAVNYSMVNTVVEFDEGKRIAWIPKPSGGKGAKWVNRRWRYELEPVDDGSKTLVRETRDISDEGIRFVLRYLDSGKTKKNMAATLELLDEVMQKDTAG
jgi:uncharacterized protein YndB with AHSA1/START domain